MPARDPKTNRTSDTSSGSSEDRAHIQRHAGHDASIKALKDPENMGQQIAGSYSGSRLRRKMGEEEMLSFNIEDTELTGKKQKRLRYHYTLN